MLNLADTISKKSLRIIQRMLFLRVFFYTNSKHNNKIPLSIDKSNEDWIVVTVLWPKLLLFSYLKNTPKGNECYEKMYS